MGGLDLGNIGTTLGIAIAALSVLATYASRASRRQRVQNRKLRTLVLDYDSYLYDVERLARQRGIRLPVKPKSLLEAHDDQPDDDPDTAQVPGPDQSPAGRSRHALQEG